MQRQTYLVGLVSVPDDDDPLYDNLREAREALLARSDAEDDTAFGLWVMPVAHLLYVAVNGEVFEKEE